MSTITEFLTALLAGAILYAPFTWLLWASGYLRILLKAAKLNRWGFGVRVEPPKEWGDEL